MASAVIANDTKMSPSLWFVWLEITGKCQLSCVHCYADSGPSGTHGTMTADDWRRTIGECADLGVRLVQFIGGEPTLHPDLPALVDHALASGLDVEVFSNLVYVSPTLWKTFGRAGVRLACSYYSDDAAEHAQITGRNTHAQTRANIAEAVRRSIPLRIGLIELVDGQGLDTPIRELEAIGVTEISTDRLRQVGRGIRDAAPSADQLCGRCGHGNVAVASDGQVWPCVFTWWMPVGNVGEASLADIISGDTMTATMAELRAAFGPVESPCVPKMCNPQGGPACSPACGPQGNCRPVGACVPTEY